MTAKHREAGHNLHEIMEEIGVDQPGTGPALH
jgi:hypothetical protein